MLGVALFVRFALALRDSGGLLLGVVVEAVAVVPPVLLRRAADARLSSFGVPPSSFPVEARRPVDEALAAEDDLRNGGLAAADAPPALPVGMITSPASFRLNRGGEPISALNSSFSSSAS